MDSLEKYIYNSLIINDPASTGPMPLVRIELNKSNFKELGNMISYIFLDNGIEKNFRFFEKNIMKNATSTEAKIIRTALISYKRKRKLSKL